MWCLTRQLPPPGRQRKHRWRPVRRRHPPTERVEEYPAREEYPPRELQAAVHLARERQAEAEGRLEPEALRVPDLPARAAPEQTRAPTPTARQGTQPEVKLCPSAC